MSDLNKESASETIDREAAVASLQSLKGAVGTLGVTEKKKFNSAYGELRALVKRYGDEAILALSFVSTEIMIEMMKKDSE